MSFQIKYQKYKNKYLDLKKQLPQKGGSASAEPYAGSDSHQSNYYMSIESISEYFQGKYTKDQIITVLTKLKKFLNGRYYASEQAFHTFDKYKISSELENL